MMSTKMKVHVRKKSSSNPVSKTISKGASPDSKCPICLDQFKNISYVDKCLHRFCFRCIQEWSRNKAECPLCKQAFSSIYHTIKAEDDFKQFDLRPTDNGSFGSLAGQRFRYRTTLTGGRWASARRTSPPPDHGVMFEGLAGTTGSGNDGGFRRMVARLAAWQRAQAEGRPLRTPQEQEVIHFRRTLYRRGLWVRGVRDGGRSRDTSAEFFRRNPACLHRLVPWLKRELTVLYGTHGSLVNIVQHIVMSQISRYDMQGAAVLQELRPFLLSRTEHFLHEFLSFARSPFNMEAYDQHVVYDCPAPSANAEESSGSDLSVIALSEDEGATATLSRTAWDDETPGPSYSSETPHAFPLPVSNSDTDSSTEEAGQIAPPPAQNDGSSSNDEDCVIVGYVKPTAERTPELVQLTSDSEEHEENSHQRIHFTSESSCSASDRSEHGCPASGSAAAVRGSALRRRVSPWTPSRARSSPAEQHHTPSSKIHRHKVENDHRRHSEKTQKGRSRNRDREHSSHHHRRRSRSRSPRFRERSRAKEAGGESLSYSYRERDRNDRCHTSRRHASPGRCSRAPSWSRSLGLSRSWSRARSRSRSRVRSRSRLYARSRSRSRAHACSKSWSTGADGWELGRSENRRRNASPSSRGRLRHKSGGKRKCKALHTDQASGGEASVGSAQRGRESREERHKKLRRRRRSASVEIVYEGGATEQHSRRHRKKKKRKKSKRRKERTGRMTSGSSTTITIPSDSGTDQEGDGPNLSLSCASDSTHLPPHSPVVVAADAAQLTSATNSTTSPLPLGGALQPVEQQADEPKHDLRDSVIAAEWMF
ncbi:topoisomerase I binding, arginine/serine-rich a [Electrophorus electricus]|uniref:topoisomerase I binding, arginine/serine-rich a n=1 Tax=Electrophorus electricus TaxID=8005 RepID=UPI0015D09470|nr:topoisomerase I binding, arginine/serine-rich a [Electrophorus electricus]XP_026880173.2 topoisomerase I binding, arginine/serine-rich a [Electrophorus electricus]XP_026880174.2 topoisomerase I binding, arginine/serine-rich a [Electrophorus electricus]XP_026880175.2 topoisomerase I binding, arginine/serine-rich a [Electrophorus electricus]